MKIFRAEQVREIDAYTIRHEPVASIDLMERAATRLAGWYVRHFHVDRQVVVFAGPGNNGGDGLAMARLLAERQYRVRCYILKFGQASADSSLNLQRLKAQGKVELTELTEGKVLPALDPSDVVVDGIFGSGLTRVPAGFPASVIQHINRHQGRVIAIDIPSGLFGEDPGLQEPDLVVRADFTLSFQFPFLAFFFDSNEAFVGRWRIQDIRLHPEAIENTPTPFETLEPDFVGSLLPRRSKFAHKGSQGHALLISGCYGMMGAALLAGEACLRSGTGLVTLHVPRFGYQVVQTAFPEAIVSLDQSDILFSEAPDLSPFSAIGIGPGLGCKPNSGKGLKQVLEQARVPLLLDADALNLLAAHPDWYALLPEASILTPHPKEFDRLAGPSEHAFARLQKQRDFARKFRVIVVLKGAYTGIATPEGKYYFNTSGNPGMATGGSGDVLSGMITGLLARGLDPADAAILAVYLHGLAGDLAAADLGEDALIAGDLVRFLGRAFLQLKSKTHL